MFSTKIQTDILSTLKIGFPRDKEGKNNNTCKFRKQKYQSQEQSGNEKIEEYETFI